MTAPQQHATPSDITHAMWAAYRSVAVHVQSDPSATQRLVAAAALAKRFDALLIGVGALTIQPIGILPGEGSLDVRWTVELQRQVRHELRLSKAVFDGATSGVQTRWNAAEDIPLAAMIKQACCADLIIGGGSSLSGQSPYRWCDPAELILFSGRPVLVVPPNGGELVAEAVIIAWKDTREARRAVADAMPFLQNALDVVVLEVRGESRGHEAESQRDAVLESLMRHGIAARAKVVVARSKSAAEVLNREAAAMNADLIVAGGYGHSRLQEWVLGGVTHDLLRAPERYVLMSH